MTRQLRSLSVATAVALLALLTFLSAGPSSAYARSLTEAERATLTKALDSFTTAMQANDTVSVVKAMPPLVLERMAEKFGVDVERTINGVAEEMAKGLKEIPFISSRFVIESAKYYEAGDRAPYAVIPSESVIAVDNGRKLLVRSNTLALCDEDSWYFIRLNDAAVTVVREAYPDLPDIKVPPESSELVEN